MRLPHWLRALIAIALALAVLRAIAVPLARQRAERRSESATLIAQLPAGLEAWCLERPALRRAPAGLWPVAGAAWRARAAAYGLPLSALAADSLLRLEPLQGDWLCGRRADGAWLIVGARDRLRPAVLRALPAGGAIARLPGGLALRAAGQQFLLASDSTLLGGSAWLDAQPRWLERDDLLLGADWLEYRAAGPGAGALLGAKWLLGRLLCEGLAWGAPDGAARLAALCPGPPPPAAADSALAALPLLRRSGPFAPDGRSLPLVASAYAESESLGVAERRWSAGSAAALARLLWLP
ncbi:hypothetical protein FJ251_07735 [bacterium]|nr:hypothetical protein [bacterium]